MFAHAARAARAACMALLCACLGAPPAFAAAAASTSGSHRSSSTKSTASTSGTSKPRSSSSGPSSRRGGGSHRAKAPVPRDAKGRIARSEDAKLAFMRQSGYPHGRPGYVVDHIVPLACGGPDAPSNMQWQTKSAAAAKDKVERRGC